MSDGLPPGAGGSPALPAAGQPEDDPPSPARSGDPADRAAWAKLVNLQRRLLPQEPPDVPGFRLGLAYRPAFVTSGDYHDFFARPDGRTAAFVGDVSGHGPAAGLLMAVMRTILRTHPDLHRDPGRTLTEVGRVFASQIPSDLFMSGIYLLFEEDGWVSWAVAGNHPPVWVDKWGRPGSVDFNAIGPLLGLRAGAVYPTLRARLAPGDRMLLFTDGLYEASNPAGEPFDRRRVWGYVLATMDDPLSEVVPGLVGAVRDHLGGAEFEDDFTILAVERVDPPAAP